MISSLAHVDPSAKLGNNVTVHPFAFIDKNVEIGDDCEIFPYASIMKGTTMGKGCRVFQGAIVGAEPQDFRWKGEDTRCEIGDNVVIREHVIINRGIRPEGATTIGSDTFIMADAHVGHDTKVMGHCVLGNGVTVAGDCEIDECSKVGKWVLIKGGCRISGNVPPYVIIAHNPAAYFGINAYIMRKKDFTDQQIDDIAKAYRNIYQSGISLYNAMRRIEADIEPSEVRSEILNFIRSNNSRIVAIPLDLAD